MDLINQLLERIKTLDIPVVATHNPVVDPKAFMDYVRDLKDAEGFVIAWPSGYRVKTKAADYLRLHKVKDSLSQEKNVIEMLISESIDDAKPFMSAEDRKRVEEFEDGFWQNVEYSAKEFESYFNRLSIDRKTWSLEHMKDMNAKNPFSSNIVFNLYNGKSALDTIIEIITKNLSTQTQVDKVRCLWGGLYWNYSFGEEQQKVASGFFGKWAEHKHVEQLQ